mmetsp:Transcript_57965/g.173002  ORF Transcript_57965/g.173002 Transcript_57965/m.173002 type:complete len:210 (-) Transcript_57965:175-804(-)
MASRRRRSSSAVHIAFGSSDQMSFLAGAEVAADASAPDSASSTSVLSPSSPSASAPSLLFSAASEPFPSLFSSVSPLSSLSGVLTPQISSTSISSGASLPIVSFSLPSVFPSSAASASSLFFSAPVPFLISALPPSSLLASDFSTVPPPFSSSSGSPPPSPSFFLSNPVSAALLSFPSCGSSFFATSVTPLNVGKTGNLVLSATLYPWV